MAGNTMTLEFAGDADKLKRASKEAVGATDDVATAADKAGDAFKKSGSDSTDYVGKLGKLGSAVDGASTAFGDVGDAMQAVSDIANQGAEKAARLARANNDVKQATEDMAQAQRDAAQAGIDSKQAAVDLRQALFDQVNAQEAYNTAVKEHGRSSKEAVQASIDLSQAGVDVKQAQEDAAQATRDLSQANIDAEAGQLDLNEAQKEAHPPEIQQWADKVQMITPLLSGLTAVVGLATAAQWAMNSALFASPLTWIVLAIAAVVAIIVIIATKTKWFQTIWRVTWGAIKQAAQAVGNWFAGPFKNAMVATWGWITKAASNTWKYLSKIPGWIGTAFKAIANVLTWPFRTAFNAIARMWNSTVGSLSWSVPGWVPGIGGNSIGVPNIPTFHAGGEVPAVPGGQLMALVQSGEQISRGGGESGWVTIRGDGFIDDLTRALAARVGARGGQAALLGIKIKAA